MNAAERALERLTQQARGEPTPPVDWTTLESMLAARLAAEPPPRPNRRWVLVVLAAALLTGTAIAVGLVEGRDTGTAPRAARDGVGPVEGDALAAGARLRARAEALEVVHPGRARWTLLPGSSARLVDRGRYLTIALEAGSVRAVVTPGAHPESFAIEVGEQRVAVKGTRFEVTLGAQGELTVRVDEGAVVVGARGRPGETIGIALYGPASRSFTAAPAPVSPPVPVLGPPSSGTPEPEATQRKAPRRALDPDPLPEEPSAVELTAFGQRLASRARECFVSATPELAEGRVSVESTLSFSVLPDGRLGSLSFAPPLAPVVESCARSGAAGLELTRSRRGATGSVDIALER